MPDTMWTILIAAVTAVATATATGLLVTPRMDARKKRIGEAHTARDTFGTHLLTILCACTRLQNLLLPPDSDSHLTPVMRDRLTAERERWLQQIEDATRWMVDHGETFAGTWPGRQLIGFVSTYVAMARGVVLSEREEAQKLELLVELTTPVQRQFFGWVWSRARHIHADRRAFDATVARLAGEPTPA